MPQGNDLLLINAVIEAIWNDNEAPEGSLSVVTRALFALVDTGERDFEALKSVALQIRRNTSLNSAEVRPQRAASWTSLEQRYAKSPD